jgi:hypothetical protein
MNLVRCILSLLLGGQAGAFGLSVFLYRPGPKESSSDPPSEGVTAAAAIGSNIACLPAGNALS